MYKLPCKCITSDRLRSNQVKCHIIFLDTLCQRPNGSGIKLTVNVNKFHINLI